LEYNIEIEEAEKTESGIENDNDSDYDDRMKIMKSIERCGCRGHPVNGEDVPKA
jgi:hypothetical protein